MSRPIYPRMDGAGLILVAAESLVYGGFDFLYVQIPVLIVTTPNA